MGYLILEGKIVKRDVIRMVAFSISKLNIFAYGFMTLLGKDSLHMVLSTSVYIFPEDKLLCIVHEKCIQVQLQVNWKIKSARKERKICQNNAIFFLAILNVASFITSNAATCGGKSLVMSLALARGATAVAARDLCSVLSVS